eukprot:359517-Chlamydomonas_euryale.AAC.8
MRLRCHTRTRPAQHGRRAAGGGSEERHLRREGILLGDIVGRGIRHESPKAPSCIPKSPAMYRQKTNKTKSQYLNPVFWRLTTRRLNRPPLKRQISNASTACPGCCLKPPTYPPGDGHPILEQPRARQRAVGDHIQP